MILAATIILVLVIWAIGCLFTLGFATDQISGGEQMPAGDVGRFVLACLVAWPGVLGAAISDRIGFVGQRRGTPREWWPD